MDPEFWHQRWNNNQIGFHENAVNPRLVQYSPELALSDGDRVFVPLCGKTLDIGWLVSNGYSVVAAELSELAVQQLFNDLGVEPKISKAGKLMLYQADKIDIFAGDIFDLTQAMVGRVDAVYDRAALVALPEDMRKQYTAHLSMITSGASQLLITFEYDQQLMKGPPFSVPNDEVRQHYAAQYQIVSLFSGPVTGGLKGTTDATANVWLLKTGSQTSL